MSKNHEALGLWTMGSAWEFGRIRLPYGDAAGQAASDMLVQEALGFVATTDLIMATWFIFYNMHGLAAYRPGAMATRMNWNPGVGNSWGPMFDRKELVNA